MPTEEETSSSPDLIARARSDPEAFAALYRQHYEEVFRYCVHRLFERSAAEDVTSTVFLKVVENLHRFEGNGRSFRNWLFRIATNAANEHLRKTRRRANLLKGAARDIACAYADPTNPSDPAGENEAVLKQALLALKERYQAIIALRFFENLSVSEIAGILGGSPATVRSQLSRALTALRKAMDAGRADV